LVGFPAPAPCARPSPPAGGSSGRLRPRHLLRRVALGCGGRVRPGFAPAGGSSGPLRHRTGPTAPSGCCSPEGARRAPGRRSESSPQACGSRARQPVSRRLGPFRLPGRLLFRSAALSIFEGAIARAVGLVTRSSGGRERNRDPQ